MHKRFNTTGACFPEMHYMVDITERLVAIKNMIDNGDYFIINRGRQYGKTTTLNALETFLTPDYLVISMDFQLLSNSDFSTEERFVSAFAREVYRNNSFKKAVSQNITDTFYKLKSDNKSFVLADLLMYFAISVPKQTNLLFLLLMKLILHQTILFSLTFSECYEVIT